MPGQHNPETRGTILLAAGGARKKGRKHKVCTVQEEQARALPSSLWYAARAINGERKTILTYLLSQYKDLATPEEGGAAALQALCKMGAAQLPKTYLWAGKGSWQRQV